MAHEDNGEIFVARQPIFDPQQAVYAYELLYRNSFTNSSQVADATNATLSVIHHAFLALGTQLTGAKRVFINFGRDALLKRMPFVLRPESTIIEVLEDVEADDVIMEVCRDLKRAGYLIALDDFDGRTSNSAALVDLADFIKFDFRATTADERQDFVRRQNGRKIPLLAEKVETPEEFNEARKAGYAYFQGYFFSKPVIVSARSIPTNKMNYLRLLGDISKPELDFMALQKTIMQDTYFSYSLLNYINSAFFGLRTRIATIQQALMFLGEREVRKWASLVTLTFVGADKSPEILATSLIRAKLCELLAEKTYLSANTMEVFLMGMFSLLDVLIGRPLGEVIAMMNVSREMKIALTTGGNAYGELLSAVCAYERADWGQCEASARKLDMDMSVIPPMYKQALEWADKALAGEG
ncbi:MAG: EAL domain-containing protein [Syntrophorhabdales bacterium]|jgi:EAL and modified HD-GYP domain-containing signal transduction protein